MGGGGMSGGMGGARDTGGYTGGGDWGARDTGMGMNRGGSSYGGGMSGGSTYGALSGGSSMGGGMTMGGGMGQDETLRTRASQIMTDNPETVTPDTSLADAAMKMRDLDVGIIPVVESESNKRLKGVVTDRDITIRAVAEGMDARTTKVSEVMTTEVETCNKNDSVADVLRVMEREQVRRVPITDREGRLVGIVAQADVARDMDTDRGEQRVADALERISEPAGRSGARGGMRASQSSRGGAFGGSTGGGTSGGGMSAAGTSRGGFTSPSRGSTTGGTTGGATGSTGLGNTESSGTGTSETSSWGGTDNT
jgi:CBS domain-containing protein